MNASITNPQPPGRSPAKMWGAVAFVVLSLGALGISAYYGRQRYLRENPPPLPDVIAPIPPEMQANLANGMKLLGKTILQFTPEQDEKIAAIWKNNPRSIAELIELQKQTDQILTAEQRAKLKPIRKGFQGKVVDHMLEPARDRFSEQDFGKLKEEIKRRVEIRIEGR